MGLLNKLLGNVAAEPVKQVGKVIDEIFTSEEERLDKQAILERIRNEPALAQAAINKMEVQHRSLFVAGWRPFCGWVCGFGLAYAFLISPTISVFIEKTPQVPTDVMFELIVALLGLGALRTGEKAIGKTR